MVMSQPASLMLEHDGARHIFGVRNMPAYDHQMSSHLVLPGIGLSQNLAHDGEFAPPLKAGQSVQARRVFVRPEKVGEEDMLWRS